MKITFLEPCDYFFYANKMGGPLGLGYIASYIENKIDEKFDFSIEVSVENALRGKPDLIGISAYTQNYTKAISAATKIKKELGIPVIIGGKHITALPENIKDCFDVGVAGDGERTMYRLVKTYLEQGNFSPENLMKIPGVVFRNDGQLYLIPPDDPLKDLDILPPPKREIMNTYWPGVAEKWNWPQGLYTSRGCPYKCPFCIHSKLKFVTRYHSPERVVYEIEEITKNYPEQKIIVIHDDLFTISKKRLKSIVDLIKSEKLNRKVSFSCMCKSNLFDEEIAFMLREMNVRFIAFGFESADEKTLQYLKNDSSKISENIEAINLCNKYGIKTAGYFIIGSPPETVEGITNTYWFIRRNYPPMNIVGTFYLTPFPGTKTWDYALEKGLVNPETEKWEKYDYHQSEPSLDTFMNENYDFNFFKNAYKNYFLELHNKDRITLYDDFSADERYYSEIFKYLKNNVIKSENKILEIGTNYLPGTDEYFEEKNRVKKLNHWNFLKETEMQKEYEKSVVGNERFDVLFFNHSIEQMLNPCEKIRYFVKNYLKSGGKLIILIKNPQFYGRLVNIIFGKWESLATGFEKSDDYFLINTEELYKNLKEMNLVNIVKIPISGNSNLNMEQFKNIFNQISQTKIDDKLPEYISSYSYIYQGDLDL